MYLLRVGLFFFFAVPGAAPMWYPRLVGYSVVP